MDTVPSPSTIVCITPPPAYSESPTTTASPENLKNEQLFSAASVPPDYLQQPENPGQAGSKHPKNPGQAGSKQPKNPWRAMFPSNVVSPESPVVGPEGTSVDPDKSKKCTCRNVLKVLGFIGLVFLMMICCVFFVVAKFIMEDKCCIQPLDISESDDRKK